MRFRSIYLSAAARADLIWRCPHCGRLWDQDENAARNILGAALAKLGPAEDSASGPAPIEISARENKGLRRARRDRKASARKPLDNPLPGPG